MKRATPRKVDLQLESGEYFLSDEQKQAKQRAAREAKQSEAAAAKQQQRDERFRPPKEPKPSASGGGGARLVMGPVSLGHGGPAGLQCRRPCPRTAPHLPP